MPYTECSRLCPWNISSTENSRWRSYRLVIIQITTEGTSTVYAMPLSAEHFTSSVIIIHWVKFYYPYFTEERNEDRENFYPNTLLSAFKADVLKQK